LLLLLECSFFTVGSDFTDLVTSAASPFFEWCNVFLAFGSGGFLLEFGLDVEASPTEVVLNAFLFPVGISDCNFRFLTDNAGLPEADMDADDNLLPPEVAAVAVLLRADRWGGTRISAKHHVSQNVIRTLFTHT
jgi:hypothetical protein